LATEALSLREEDATLDPVDPEAPRKYEALDREISRIRENTQDLKVGRERLIAAAEETEVQAQVLFSDALERAGGLFDRYVRRLFGGGEARLTALVPGAVAVHVRLPGKKECALTLLSGGEKSLSGLALAIAIAVASSGTGALVLDEPDHALDDANTKRLADFLKEIAQTHQIIMVTHNPITIESADRIVAVWLGNDRTAQAIELKARDVAPWLVPLPSAATDRESSRAMRKEA
jgi:chromosome segregation protein